jgi:hemolysin activation/secretion protein
MEDVAVRLKGHAINAIADWALAVFFAVAAVPAAAQGLPNAGSLLKDLRDREQTPQESHPPAVIAPLVRPTIRLPDGATLKVASFRITGNTLIGLDSLQPLVKEWEGRTLDLAGLNEAASALTRYYQAHGYILSYAYLPAQKVENDVVEIAILEGRIGAVQVVAAQDVRLDDQVIQNHVATSNNAQVAQQDVLERQLLLLNDIPGVVARGAFTPGAVAGSSDLVVSVVEDTPLASSVYLNNYGNPSTGDQTLGAQFQLRDLFGVGDSTQLGLAWAAGGGLASGDIENTLPLGGNGLSLRTGFAHLTYALQYSFADLGARGNADTVHIGLGYALLRSAAANLTLRGDLQYSYLRDQLALVQVDNRKNSRSATLGLDINSQDDWLAGGRLSGHFGYQSGSLQFESGDDSLSSAGSFDKMNLEIAREQQITQTSLVYFRASAQGADKNLDSSEKFSLGGPTAVRAYAPGELNVDDGTLLTLEYRYQLPLQGGLLTATVFSDYAYGSINHQPLAGVSDNESSLNGAGLGLSWRTGADLEFLITAAWRGAHLPTVGDDRQPRIFFQFTKGL